jgi:hypothetical protein
MPKKLSRGRAKKSGKKGGFFEKRWKSGTSFARMDDGELKMDNAKVWGRRALSL